MFLKHVCLWLDGLFCCEISQEQGEYAEHFPVTAAGASLSQPSAVVDEHDEPDEHDEHGDTTSSSTVTQYGSGALLPIPPPKPTMLRSLVTVGVPFLLLSITYSFWFVSQKVFNNQYRTNAFGYACP
jgi:hypothetical protein